MGVLSYFARPALGAIALILAGSSVAFGNGDSVPVDTITVVPVSSPQTTTVVYQPLRFDQFITPEIGYYFFDPDRDINNGLLLAMRYGFMVNDQFGWEGQLGVVPTTETGGDNIWFPFARINALLNLVSRSQSNVVPYLTAGLNGDFHDGAHIGLNVGLGVNFFTGRSFAWRVEVNDKYVLGDNFNEVMASVGASFYFPNPQARETVVVTAVEGEEMGVATIRTPQEVYDYFDDLVILFDFDSAQIDPRYDTVLNSMARVLINNPEVTLRLKGFSDSVGRSAYNINLSRNRAVAVQNALVARGISPTRLVIEADAAAPLRDANLNPVSGELLNRRVEFEVI